jgi:hypothetical protein
MALVLPAHETTRDQVNERFRWLNEPGRHVRGALYVTQIRNDQSEMLASAFASHAAHPYRALPLGATFDGYRVYRVDEHRRSRSIRREPRAQLKLILDRVGRKAAARALSARLRHGYIRR